MKEIKNKFKFSKKINGCQICSSKKIKNIMFFGFLPPVNDLEKIGTLSSHHNRFPLNLVKCNDCGHVQLDTIVSKEILFPFSYPYLSGTTKILNENFSDLYKESKKIIGIKENDLIIDIGSNDGTLLKNFKKANLEVLGIEPSQAGEIANNNGISTIIDYFNDKIVKKIKKKYKKPKIITATNVFAHIENPNSIVMLIKKLLGAESVFISESHYLLPLLKTLQYDTIYHEHLRYYHLSSLIKLFSLNGLEVFHAKKIPTHGGSIRVYTSLKGKYKKTNQFKKILSEEKFSGLDKPEVYENFKKQIISSKFKLLKILIEIKKKKKRIFGVGAPSRASTLANFTGIDENLVDCILEVKNSNKLNKYLPGTLIPILDEKIILKDSPNYLLIFSWHIKKELISIFKKKGFKGSFIIPLPTPKIIK